MTPKEKIYARYIDTKNEERAILGLKPIDKDKSLANGYARNHTIKELEEDLTIALHSLAATKHKAKINAFFDTEAGASYKADLEAQHESLIARRIECQNTTLHRVREFIDKSLGCNWKIQSFGDRSFTLQMCDDNGKSLFGHDIDFHYSAHDNSFEMNYGSFGAFDPTASPCRSAYLKGMATISDPTNATELKEILMDFSRECDEIRNKEYDIKNKLQNPPTDE